ncbi:hypothetical protein ACFL35_07855 [Candidatus Riflebacteria bacterium]
MLEVSEEIKHATKKCNRGMSCLKNHGKNLCKVKYCVLDEMFYIECQETKNCPYQHAYGNGLFCRCPVRKEIYKLYKI